MNDLASLTYAYNILIGGYGFALFLYWWVIAKRASSWYLYVMLLLLAYVVTNGFQLGARYFLFSDPERYRELLSSWTWAAKSWLGSLTMTVIAGHATWRLVNCWDNRRN